MRIVLLALLIAGCGRIGFSSDGADANPRIDGRPLDDAGLGDPNGYWVWTSGKLTQESQTRSRADLQNGIRADLVIDGAAVGGRIAALGNGVPLALATSSGVITTFGARWIAVIEASTSVFDVTWTDADHMTLRRDPTAPETSGVQQIDEANLERTPPLPGALVGTKVMSRIEYADSGDVAAEECGRYRTSDSQRIAGSITISPLFVATIAFEFRYYNGSSCQGTEQLVMQNGFGFLEVEAGTFRHLIDLDGASPANQTGTIMIDQTSIRFTNTACIPAGTPECTDGPLMVTLLR